MTKPEIGSFTNQKYTLNELKCATFRQKAYRTMHWDADLAPRPWKSRNPAP